ncbi:transcription cofactor vestigial-like protein 1 [Apodemus sylvaticus]|uniref:transcription cofactor vestigial-like protein 1 n=1 Tax=Apodemus sylvaticus TaxID=10129 RepID=UPI002243621B|nr:transcription cofactor vestigial-like protein 1 [Apodemus sylvaticus]
MEEMKKTGVQMSKSRQNPIKTEWNSRCVLFTYFQGDIGSVVDEHFSRALSNLKRPQDRSSSSHSENVILKNGEHAGKEEAFTETPVLPDGFPFYTKSSQTENSGELKEEPVAGRGTNSSMPPNQWCLSSWTKPQPEASPANGASGSSLDDCGPKAPSGHPQGLWHFSPLARPDFLEPACFRDFPDRHLAPEVYPEGKHGSLHHLVQQDRHQNHPLEPAARENRSPAKIAGSPGSLMNLPSSTGHYKKKIHGHGPASASLDNERSQSPERRRDINFY